MPIPDYTFKNVPRPTERLMQGLQIGQGISNIIQQREQQEAAQERQDMINTELSNLNALERPTAADYARVASLLPKEQADSVRANWELLSKDKQSNKLRFSGQVLAAFNASPEIAIKMLKERATAERNAGNEEDALANERWAKLAEVNPDAASKMMGTMVAIIPGGDKILESVGKIGVEERAEELHPIELNKKAADLGLTKAQTNEVLARTKKLGIESKKAVMELESLKKGELSPEKKFDQEKKLRDEYAKKTANFTEGTRNYEVIKSSAADNSGAGDVALVTSFMKMLDPGSVVRETEFANARDTAGLLEQLKNQAQKIQTGQFLGVEQRAAFSRLAKQYLDAAKKQQEGVKKDLGVIVKNYSLNEENVFGIEEEEIVAEEAPVGAQVQQVGRFQIETIE